MGDRALPVVLFLVAVGAALAVHAYSGYTLDDSFITFRYAENLAAGNGFVYNAGERELGTTTPLYTLLLALFVSAGFAASPTALAIGVLSFGGTVVVAWRLVRRGGANPLLAGLFGLGLCGCPPLLRDAISGMETSLYAFLCLLVIDLCLAGRMAAFCAAGTALLLTRPDGAIALAACGLFDLWTGRRRLRRWVLYAAVVAGAALPWFLFSWSYFGLLLPNSGFAKRLQVDDWGHFTRLAAEEVRWLSVLFPLVLLGLVHAATRFRDGLLPGFFAGLYAAVFALLSFPACGWYLGPVHAPLLVLAALGATWLLSAPGAPRRLLWAALAVVAGVHAAGWPGQVRAIKRDQVWMDSHHGEIGRWLARNTPEDAVVAVDNIGYIGYYSGRRILDMTGLIQRDVREGIARTGDRRFAILTFRPEYLAIQDRGSTPKYTPPREWLEAQGYRAVLVVPYSPTAAYRVYQRPR